MTQKKKQEIQVAIKNTEPKDFDDSKIIHVANSDKSMTDISDDFYIKYVSEFTKKEEPYFVKQIEESKKNNKNNEKEEILKPKRPSKRNKTNKIEEKKNNENNIEIEKINSEDDVENNAVLKGSVEKTEVDIEYEDNNSLNTLDGLFKTMKKIDDTVNMFNFSFLDELNNSFKPEFNFDELMNNRMNDVNDINSIHNNNEEKNVIETVLNKEKKKKIKYRLRVSPWEILVFDTKEEFIDKVGEIIADELRQAVINRSYADGYFKPGRV